MGVSPMAETTTTTTSTQPQVESQARETASRLLPWWEEATAAQQTAIVADRLGAYTSDGLPFDAYCEEPVSLAEHMACVEEQREQEGLPPVAAEEPAPEPVSPPAEPTPAFTLAQANATLAKFGAACKHATEQN